MEEELRCAVCKQMFTNPVLLPCYHAVCLGCAIQIQQPVQNSDMMENIDNVDADKLSVLSETDSGVVCNSRPCSYIGSPGFQVQSPPSSTLCFSLTCPTCKKATFFDEQGARNLPTYSLMCRILEKYCEARDIGSNCELCETVRTDATVFCDQCQVFYCEECRERCHPMRGPLVKHSLLSPQQGKILLKNRQAQKTKSAESGRCFDHPCEALSYYCLLCRIPMCSLCVEEQRHGSHDVQPLPSICKSSKTELSQSLQQLSEKARAVTEFIQRLKLASEKLNASCEEIENAISTQISAIIEALKAREQELIIFARQDRDSKVRRLKEQVSMCTGKLQKTTGLLQFCIEALKETDPSSFLQVGNMLVHRVSTLDFTWQNEMATLSSRITPTLDLELEGDSMLRAVEMLNFTQMKPPSAPSLIQEECVAENNSITVAWSSHPTAFVEGYVLELDDGSGGAFREVYVGKETVCTVDGLHFNSLYQARVKAFNSCGEGTYSETIGLHTAEVAWFSYEPADISPDVRLSDDLMTATVDSFEHKVILGSLGFSRGVHYWEYKVNKYEGSADPAFGIARIDVSRNMMLGKDDKGWAMYVDHQRSWFMHCNIHADRTEGGIRSGSTIGILLDLDRRQLSFYVNDEPQDIMPWANPTNHVTEMRSYYAYYAPEHGWNDFSIFQRNIMPWVNPTNHVTEVRGYYAYHAPERDGNNETFPSARSHFSSWMDGKGNWWIAGGVSNNRALDDIWHYSNGRWNKIYDLDSKHHRSHPTMTAGSTFCACGEELYLSIPKKDVNETEIWVYDGNGWTTYLCLSDDASSPCPHTKAVFTVCDTPNYRILLIDAISAVSINRRVWSFDLQKFTWQQERASVVGVSPQFEKCTDRWSSVDGVALLCLSKLFWLDLETLQWFEFINLQFEEVSVRHFAKINDRLLMVLVHGTQVSLATGVLGSGTFQFVKGNKSTDTAFVSALSGRTYFVQAFDMNNSSSFVIEKELRVEQSETDSSFSFHVLPLIRPQKEISPSEDFKTQDSFTFLYILLVALFLLSVVICIFLCGSNRTGKPSYQKGAESLSCRVPASPVRYTAIRDESFLQ